MQILEELIQTDESIKFLRIYWKIVAFQQNVQVLLQIQKLALSIQAALQGSYLVVVSISISR